MGKGIRYSDEFKQGAVNQVVVHGYLVLEVSQRLDWQFEVDEPNRWWVSDITCIHTHEGFLFLAVAMDLFSRTIVGWSMAPRITDDLVLDALTTTYWRRTPNRQVNFHSGQGSQYRSANWRPLLKTL